MKSLLTAIKQVPGNATPGLIKHLKNFGLTDWADITKVNLSDFKAYLLENCASSTARVYLSILSSVLTKYEGDATIPCTDFKKIVKTRGCKATKTFLDLNELARLERVPTRNPGEKFVKYEFLVGAYTGMRYSDLCEVSPENISNGMLTYTSIKTGVTATIPLKPQVNEWIKWLNENAEHSCTLAGYNKIIRRLCRNAGITKRVKVHKGDNDYRGEKWEFISSHTARISFVTNLINMGAPLASVSMMAGHTNLNMTERYIAEKTLNLDERTMEYFK